MSDREEYQKWLSRLAALKGIEPEYWDVWGHVHSNFQETQIKILSAMGCRLRSLGELKKEVQAEENRDWRPVTEPILIVSGDALPKELTFQIPANHDKETDRLPPDIQVRINIKEESGNGSNHFFSQKQLLFKGAKTINGRVYLRGSLPFPEGLPLGYHQIFLTLKQTNYRFVQTVKVIVCPGQTYLPLVLRGIGKRAGLMISLAGLRSKNNWGVGDFGDLRELVRWAIDVLQVEVIGLLPLHALSNHEPYNISPYYPSSRLYRNPIYLNIPEIEEYNYSPKAWKIMMAPETQELLAELRDCEKVQFEKVDTLKRKVLENIFETFLVRHWKAAGQKSERQKNFQAYIKNEGKLLDHYAVYCALTAHFERTNPEFQTWEQWPHPFQDPYSREVKIFQENHWQEVLFHKYLQWQVEAQLSEVQEMALQSGSGIGLYHDLALGIDPWGADSWAYRGFTIPGVRVGAPPDDFSPKGQDWGFFPPNEEKYRQDGYELFALEIRKNSRPGGALRIDHIMKFFRLFWILEGRDPQEGAYVKYDLEDYLKILALESVRNKTLIIGEDLGTLPNQLSEILHRYGIFSYRLFYFEKDESGILKSPEIYPDWALASVSTHDLPTLAGFWGMDDLVLRKELGLFPEEEPFHQALADRIIDKRRMIDRLHQLGFLSEEEACSLQAQGEPVLTEELHRAVLSFLVSTKAKLVALSQEDLFLEKEQLNLPGTVTAYPNWSRKMRYSVEELWNHPEARKFIDRYRELIEKSGRGVKRSDGN